MSNSRIEVDQIIKKLRIWATQLTSKDLIAKAYLFGSIINREGQHFVISGAIESDIDVLLILPSECDSALDRADTCGEIQKTVASLELELAKTIGHTPKDKKNIVSILLITDYELYHCIHKGFDPKIYTHNIFYDLLVDNEGSNKLNVINDYIDYRYHLESIELFTVARLTQKLRNSYLKTNTLDQHVDNLNYDGYDPLPKEMMRGGALLNYVYEGGEASQDKDVVMLRTDLEKGEAFLVSKILELVNTSNKYKRLSAKIASRSFLRSDNEPLEPMDVLLLGEIMFDLMKELTVPSVREVIDDLIESKSLNETENRDV